MVNKKDLVGIRPFRLSDRNFVLATFLRGLYYGDSWFSQMNKATFMYEYHKILMHIMSNPNTEITVACLREDPETILAYSLTSKDQTTLHWVFTKKAWRGIGITKDLVPQTVTTVTHLTKTGLSIIHNKKSIEFNPFKL